MKYNLVPYQITEIKKKKTSGDQQHDRLHYFIIYSTKTQSPEAVKN